MLFDLMLLVDVAFGTSGNASPYLGDGWLRPEVDNHRTRGTSSTLSIPIPPHVVSDPTADLYLELCLTPYFPANKVPHQTLIVTANGHQCPETRIQAGDNATLGYDIPRDVIAGATVLEISLRCPDAVSPQSLQLGADSRMFAFRVRRVTLQHAPQRRSHRPRRMPPLYLPGGLKIASEAQHKISTATLQISGLTTTDLAMRFESLGSNCEFGMFQKRCGAAPLGLLRFNAAPLPNLLGGLENRFDGADDPALIWLCHDNRQQEYYMKNDRYQFRMHTFRHVGDVDEADLHRQMVTAMKFLRRRLLETLTEADKICVYQRHALTTPAHMLPLLRRLRTYGHNRLVYITEDEMIAAGTVDDLGDGLYHAYIDSLAGRIDVRHVNLAPWLSICANTLALIG